MEPETGSRILHARLQGDVWDEVAFACSRAWSFAASD